jgi:tetratricopeptide (TPR) repeat protein
MFVSLSSQGSASAFSALGFTKHLKGDFDGAIEMYHQALSRQPDDPFSSEMLNRALQEAISVKLTIQSPRPERGIRTPQRSMEIYDQYNRSSTQRRYQDTTMVSHDETDVTPEESGDVEMSFS